MTSTLGRVFVSYCRADSERTRVIARHLRTAGYAAWFDEELTGGQRWWDEVLRQIRECDVFLSVVSERFTRSVACQSELEYATTLQKPLLPVVVEAISPRFLGPVLGNVQMIDYRSPSTDSALQLMGAIRALPAAPPLPTPLPQQPDVPVSYVDDLKARVESSGDLNRGEQLRLLEDLQGRIDGEEAGDVRQLLMEFRARPDLIGVVRDRIDGLLVAAPGPTPLKPASSQSDAKRPSTWLWVGLAAALLITATCLCMALLQY